MANFELTRELVEQLQTLIEQKNEAALSEILKELHPADIGEIYEELNIEEAKYLYYEYDWKMREIRIFENRQKQAAEQ